jgi:tetratricopeptide (TPR) repeat protein
VIAVADALLGHRRWGTHARLAAVAGGTLAWRSFVLAGSGGGITLMDNPLVRQPWLGRIPTTLAMAARYVGKLVWPLHLSADYSFREIAVVGWSDPGCLAGLALLVALLAATVALRRSRAALVGLVLLAVPLALVLLVAFLALGPPLAERLLYLPSAGFCVLLALALAGIAERGAAGRLVGCAAAAVVLVAYGALTVARNRVWGDPETFFRTLVADAPQSARSHRELGVWLGEKEKTDAAVAELEASMAILPHPATAYAMGIVLGRAGRRQAAIEAYENALKLRPDFAEAMVNLGTTYFQREDDATALAWFAKAMAINPNLPELQMNSANSLQRIGRLPEAAERYARAVELDPRDPAIRFNYGLCLERLNRPADAAQQYELAAELHPDWPAPHQRLIFALLNADRRDAAAAAYERAARQFPDNESIKALHDSVKPPATPCSPDPTPRVPSCRGRFCRPPARRPRRRCVAESYCSPETKSRD